MFDSFLSFSGFLLLHFIFIYYLLLLQHTDIEPSRVRRGRSRRLVRHALLNSRLFRLAPELA